MSSIACSVSGAKYHFNVFMKSTKRSYVCLINPVYGKIIISYAFCTCVFILSLNTDISTVTKIKLS